MNQGNVSKLITGFIILIVGTVLIGVVANSSAGVTNLVGVDNESIDLSTARAEDGEHLTINISDSNYTLMYVPSGWQATECPISRVAYHNTTATFTVGTDYDIWSTVGVLQILPSATMNTTDNTTYVDFSYCPDDYLIDGWNRSVLNVVSGLFAIALLLAAIAIFYQVAKDEKILEV